LLAATSLKAFSAAAMNQQAKAAALFIPPTDISLPTTMLFPVR